MNTQAQTSTLSSPASPASPASPVNPAVLPFPAYPRFSSLCGKCVVVDDRIIHRFHNFPEDLQEVMFFNNQLFYHLATFRHDEVDRMYRLIHSPTLKNVSICISCSDISCTVWISLRSPSAKQLSQCA